MNKQKGIILLPILIAVLLVGVLLLFAYKNSLPNQNVPSTSSGKSAALITNPPSSTQNPTSQPLNGGPKEKYTKEWQSYTSERFNFSFNNPGEFFLETTYEDYYPDQGHINIYETEYWDFVTSPPQGIGGPPSIGISVYDNPDNLGLLEWAKKDRAHSNYKDSHTETIVDGKPAIRFTWEGMGPGETVLLLDDNSGNIVSIAMFVTDNLKAPFENILNSFKIKE